MNNTMKNKMIRWYNLHQDECYYQLSDIYGRYSDTKVEELRKIKARYEQEYLWYSVHVHRCNGDFFITTAICDKENESFFIVETKSNTYICGYYNRSLIDLQTGEVFYES